MNLVDYTVQATHRLQTAGIETARLDVLVLLEDILQIDRASILGHPEAEMSHKQQTLLDALVARRMNHEPLAYIRGRTEFYGREFVVNEHVLVPRPETEAIIDNLKKLQLPANIVAYDIGTGSGAIAVTTRLEIAGIKVVGTDIDPLSLEVARINAANYNAEVGFECGDLLDPMIQSWDYRQSESVILSNLPYVPDNHEVNAAAKHEPSTALYSGSDGLGHYRRMYEQINILPKKPLYIITESLPKQHSVLVNINRAVGYSLLNSDDLVQVWSSTAQT